MGAQAGRGTGGRLLDPRSLHNGGGVRPARGLAAEGKASWRASATTQRALISEPSLPGRDTPCFEKSHLGTCELVPLMKVCRDTTHTLDTTVQTVWEEHAPWLTTETRLQAGARCPTPTDGAPQRRSLTHSWPRHCASSRCAASGCGSLQMRPHHGPLRDTGRS